MNISIPLIAAVALASTAFAQTTPGILHTEVNSANGHTYHLLDVSNWQDAEAAAVALGGHLTTINDAAEQAWVNTTFSNWNNVTRHLWIGYTDQVVEGTWTWIDGSTASYTNWWIAGGSPNNATGIDPLGEDYALIYPTGEWEDLYNEGHTNQWFPNTGGIVEISGPVLSLSGTCPGQMTASVSGMTAAGPVVFARGFPNGITNVPGGACAGLVIPLASAQRLASTVADANGDASLTANAPASACGVVILVAVDAATCTATNVVAL